MVSHWTLRRQSSNLRTKLGEYMQCLGVNIDHVATIRNARGTPA